MVHTFLRQSSIFLCFLPSNCFIIFLIPPFNAIPFVSCQRELLANDLRSHKDTYYCWFSRQSRPEMGSQNRKITAQKHRITMACQQNLQPRNIKEHCTWVGLYLCLLVHLQHSKSDYTFQVDIAERECKSNSKCGLKTYPTGPSSRQILVGCDNINVFCKCQHLKYRGLFIM